MLGRRSQAGPTTIGSNINELDTGGNTMAVKGATTRPVFDMQIRYLLAGGLLCLCFGACIWPPKSAGQRLSILIYVLANNLRSASAARRSYCATFIGQLLELFWPNSLASTAPQ